MLDKLRSSCYTIISKRAESPNERKVKAMEFTYITMEEYCKILSEEALRMQAQGLTGEEILHNIADLMHDLFEVKGYRLAKG